MVSEDGLTYTLNGSADGESCWFQVAYTYGSPDSVRIVTSLDYVGQLDGLCGNCLWDRKIETQSSMCAKDREYEK